MSSSLHIEGDPTPWMLAETQPAEPTWLRASEPVALAVTKPLPGTLILSPRCAGSIALLPRAVQSDGGWTPCAELASARIYLPSPVGAPVTAPGYELAAPDTDLTALESRITSAMCDGSVIAVAVSTLTGPGVIALNGAVLSFVILAPPA